MKKRCFAQNDVLTATGHRSAYFDTRLGMLETFFDATMARALNSAASVVFTIQCLKTGSAVCGKKSSMCRGAHHETQPRPIDLGGIATALL